MNKKMLALGGLISVLTATAVAWGSFVSSYPCPNNSQFPNGLSYRGGRLYVATNSPPYNVWQLNPNTGSVFASLASPASNTRGLTTGTAGETVSFWISSYQTRTIYQCGYISGSIVASFALPSGYLAYGLGFRDATRMYVTDHNARRLYVMHPLTGSFASAHDLAFEPNDCTYDARGYLWITDGEKKLVRMCNLTGSTLNSFSVEAYGVPAGIAQAGNYVYVGIQSPAAVICRFDVSDVAVAPSSYGKVKALYR